MATQYLSKTGLTYFWGRIQALFVAKETGKGLSTNDYTDEDKAEVAKIAGLVATGGEPNVIETVKVNGTALTVTDKAVNVVAVTDIRASGQSLTSSNGIADIPSTTITSDEGHITAAELSPDGYGSTVKFNRTGNGTNVEWQYYDGTTDTTILPDETRVNALIAAAVTAGVGDITGFEYEVVASLPASGEKGVIYLVPNSGNAPNIKDEYIWINKGTAESPDYAFELLGTTELDLSGYLQTTDIEAITTAEIDEITGNTTPTP